MLFERKQVAARRDKNEDKRKLDPARSPSAKDKHPACFSRTPLATTIFITQSDHCDSSTWSWRRLLSILWPLSIPSFHGCVTRMRTVSPLSHVRRRCTGDHNSWLLSQFTHIAVKLPVTVDTLFGPICCVQDCGVIKVKYDCMVGRQAFAVRNPCLVTRA